LGYLKWIQAAAEIRRRKGGLVEVRKFETGSQRDIRDGKGRFDLLPPEALFALAKHFEQGARKYEDRNWEKGQDLGTYCDSGLRHLVSFMAGQVDEDHLVAAAWNLVAAITTRARIQAGILPSTLDNMPPQHLRTPNAMLESGRERPAV
jgi:hypothetical protein